MINGLYHAHSGLRYLVLLAGFAALLYLAYGWATRAPYGKAARALTGAFLGLAYLQALLGLLLVALGIFYPKLMGHLTMMALAIAAGQGLVIAARRAADARRAHLLGLVGVLLALGLMMAGIAAIGRGPFQATPRPSAQAPA